MDMLNQRLRNSALFGLEPGQIIPFVYNLRPGPGGNLPQWAKAKAQMRNRIVRPRVAFLGPSTDRGEKSGTGAGATDSVLGAPARRFAEILSARGLPARNDSWFGGSNYSTAGLLTSDSRFLALNTGWAVEASNGEKSLGGRIVRQASGTLTAEFAPGFAVNKALLLFAGGSGNSTFTVKNEADSTLYTYTPTGSPNVEAQVIDFSTIGTHTMKIARSSGGSTWPLGAIFYNDTVSAIDVLNFGWGGAFATDFVATAQPWNTYNALSSIGMVLSIVQFGPNEAIMGVSLSEFKTALDTLVKRLKALGSDVIVRSQTPDAFSGSLSNEAAQALYAKVSRAVAFENDCVFDDAFSRWHSVARSDALGFYNSDDLHLSSDGSTYIADTPAQICMIA